uniref:Ras- protein Rab-10 n=1 Tax=Sphaerodactylus townsendi TaxID=933632 RepID=A0ACB8FD93_9SAUR
MCLHCYLTEFILSPNAFIADHARKERKADENVEVILLGNKCDNEAERAIPKHRGEKLAWEYGIPFFETSAKNNVNIEHAFSVLAEEILDKELK